MCRFALRSAGFREVEALANVAGRRPTGEPRQQVGQPHVGDDPRDVVLIFGGFAVAHSAGEHRVDDLLDVVDLAGGRCVGEDVGARHRLGQQRVSLHCTVEFAHHETQPMVGSCAGQRRPVGLGVDALELPAQRGNQQVHLGGKVSVQRADRDIGAVGHRAHLDCLEAALGGDRQCCVQDSLSPLPLGLRAQFRLGEHRNRHYLARLRTGRRPVGG